MDIVKAKKVELLTWLRNDSFILEHVSSNGLITQNEYVNVDSTPNPSEKTKTLLNLILNKGDATCIKFLQLLKNENVNESCPELRTWIETVTIPSGKSSETDLGSNKSTSQAAMQMVPDYLAFFKKNRSKLIDMVTNVDKIIDDIDIQDEMMSNIQAEQTTQAKMRKIIEFTKSKKAAERLYNALKKHEFEIMEEIE